MVREPATVTDVTTVLDQGDVLMVRCDSCRRLWPVARDRLASAGWLAEGEDRHVCPACGKAELTLGRDHDSPTSS
jgi:predicted RNA-binding Zn-ribbon protein involved in translation (DUF1610 family)